MTVRPPYVAVVGPGEAGPELVGPAREVGRKLAEAGAVVVTGGLGGVMAAACAGAAAAGGTTVGLLPGHDRAASAPDLTVALPTGLGEARDVLVVRAADAVVAVGGSWGTVAEVALACRTGVPVVALGGWVVRDADGALPPDGPEVATDAASAVRRALALAGRRP